MIDDECDEAKSYYEWVAKNLDYIQQNKQHLSVMKKLYIEGYAAGWQQRKKYNAMEWLEK